MSDFYDSGYGQQYGQQQGESQFDYGTGNDAYDWNSGSFGAGQQYDQGYSQQQQAQYVAPSMMTPQYNYQPQISQSTSTGNTFTNFDDEPPLLEELGINFEHIQQKTLSVLNPWQTFNPSIMDDTDLAGPLVFCLAFGGLLLLSGKVHGFGYIYGVGVMGCLALYAVLNLMAVTGVTLTCVVSVLGYCLLPMVLLAAAAVLFTLQGTLGTVLTVLVILWCSISASKLFVTVLAMDSQQPLVGYPCALLYGVFALLTVF